MRTSVQKLGPGSSSPSERSFADADDGAACSFEFLVLNYAFTKCSPGCPNRPDIQRKYPHKLGTTTSSSKWRASALSNDGMGSLINYPRVRRRPLDMGNRRDFQVVECGAYLPM